MNQTIHSSSSTQLTGKTTPYQKKIAKPRIRYLTHPIGELARRSLVFESNPPTNHSSRGSGVALVQLDDERVFFFKAGLEVFKSEKQFSILLEELHKLPNWVANWQVTADLIGYEIGTAIEFIDSDPTQLENWGVSSWRKQAASLLAVGGAMVSIAEIRTITSDLATVLEEELKTLLVEFSRGLDPYSNDLSIKLNCSWQTKYNFFNPAIEQQRLYRRQALQTFPLFIQQILDPSRDMSASLLIDAIDTGIPLVSFLAERYGCPQKCVRHLNGLHFQDIGIQWLGRLRELLIILGSIDLNRLPKGQSEWGIFTETVNLLTMLTYMPITSLSSRLLLGELSKLKWKRKLHPALSFQERALAIERFSEQVRLSIVATAWVNGTNDANTEANAQIIASRAACSLGLSRLEPLSRKWRAEELLLESKRMQQIVDMFPIVFEGDLKVGDLRIIQILSGAELIAEGKHMNNCVGGYTGECSNGRAFIFSVRDSVGRPNVTIEYSLQLSKGMPELILVQQKGKGNSVPDGRFSYALNYLDQYLSSPAIRRKLLQLMNHQKIARKAGADLAGKYIRSLEFVEFLKTESVGKFDFAELLSDLVNKEQASLAAVNLKFKQ